MNKLSQYDDMELDFVSNDKTLKKATKTFTSAEIQLKNDQNIYDLVNFMSEINGITEVILYRKGDLDRFDAVQIKEDMSSTKWAILDNTTHALDTMIKHLTSIAIASTAAIKITDDAIESCLLWNLTSNVDATCNFTREVIDNIRSRSEAIKKSYMDDDSSDDSSSDSDVDTDDVLFVFSDDHPSHYTDVVDKTNAIIEQAGELVHTIYKIHFDTNELYFTISSIVSNMRENDWAMGLLFFHN